MKKTNNLIGSIIIWKTKTKYVLRSLIFLIKNLGDFKYFFRWIKSFRNNHNALDDELPWLTYDAVKWLENFLSDDKYVFEYGSGGSTLFLAKRANKVVSVEHDKQWYKLVERKLAEKNLENVEYILQVPRVIGPKENTKEDCFPSTEPKYKGMCFEKYVKSIDRYPDKYFDLVVVDGRSRRACIKRSVKKVKPGGYLMLDNSERKLYEPLFEELKDFRRTDFFGLGNYNLYPWQTTLWEIK